MSEIITISGDLGSGKTRVSQVLAARLGYKYISTGQIHRSIAEELLMNSLELNVHAESDPDIDKRVDSVLIRLASDGTNYVVDSRLAWHFVKNSLKVCLTVDPNLGAARVFADSGRREEPLYANQAGAKAQLMARKESENRRFLSTYGIDCADLHNYDVVIDTSYSDPEQVTAQLLVVIARWREGKRPNQRWVSPRILFPTEHVRQLAGREAKELCSKVKREGFDPERPVDVVSWQGFLFIWDGHKRVSAALMNETSLIPMVIVASDHEHLPTTETADEFAKASINPSWYYDWEDVHSFRFMNYPSKSSGFLSGV
jgi:predicted cytidylate kinase